MARLSPAPAPATGKATPLAAVSDSTPDAAAQNTKARLLEAAGEVFAERGFKDATVREICTRAGANIAAVNYYFQGKDSLYISVIDYAQDHVKRARPIRIDPDAEPEEQLRQFLLGFVARVLDPAGPAWHAKIMLREMVEPSAALDKVVNDTIRPTFQGLSMIIAKIVPGLNEEQLRYCTTSVLGQCLMHRHCEPVLARLFPSQACACVESLERLAGHVFRFSMAGLAAVREGLKGTDGHAPRTGRGTPARARRAEKPARKKGKR
jgi:AcrR family transcriptional regulator